jgi:hypothetical protein
MTSQALAVQVKNTFSAALAELEKDIDFAAWQVTATHLEKELSAALKQVDLKLQEHRSKNKQATVVVL